MALSSNFFPSHPTQTPYPLIGHLPYMRQNMLEFLLGLGVGHDLSSFEFGLSTRYLVNNPELLRELWQDARFERTNEIRKVLASVAGAGLLSQEGAVHRQQRRMMQPAFHRERLSGYFTIMIKHAEDAIARWRTQERIDVRLEMKRLALDIVGGSLFSQEDIAQVHQITAALERLLPKLDNDVLLHGLLPGSIPVWYLGQDREDINTIRDGLHRIIQARRNGPRPQIPDLLEMLLETRDEDGSTLSDTDIAAQSLTLVSAGFETTANTLTWMWWLLAEHPEALHRVQLELEEVLGGRTPTLEDLPRLRSVDQVIKETQRLYPAAWITSRMASEDLNLGTHRFSKGSVFFMSPYVTQRDPRYFPNPTQFRPERFEDEANLPKFAYLPFGAGVHQCIGNVFALWEMKVILAMVAQQVHLQPDAGFQPKMKLAITLGMEEFSANLHWHKLNPVTPAGNA
jgi:cytochrome P450